MANEHKTLLAELAWLRRVANGLVGNDSAAADLTQEVALEMLRQPPRDPGVTEDRSRLRAWLWTVARRRATRDRKWARAQTRSERAASRAEIVEDGGSSRDHLALHRDLLAEIHALDEADADLIVQRYLDQKPPRVIASAMGLPVPVVRKRLSRAMDRLRVRLAESERGAEGWSLGLCVLLGSRVGPVGPGQSCKGESAVLRRSGGLGTGRVALLVVGVAAVGATWFAMLSPTLESDIADPSLLNEAIIDSGQAELAAVPGPEEGVAAGERVAAVESVEVDPAESAGSSTAHALATVQFVDEENVPVTAARAVWADEASTPHALDVDSAGTAQMPLESQGWLYAGADGFETSTHPVSWSDAGAMTVILKRFHAIRGQLFIDGVAPGREVALWMGNPSWNGGYFAGGDPRLHRVIKARGLIWGDENITTDREGNFEIITRTDDTDFDVRLPGDLRLVGGEGIYESGFNITTNYASRLDFEASTTEMVLYAESSVPAEARFVDSLTSQPVEGFAFVNSYDAAGKRLGNLLIAGLDDDGRLRMPTQQRASVRDVDWIPCYRYEIQVERQSFQVALTRPGEAEDLGTFKVGRVPFAYLKLGTRSKNGLEALQGVASSDEDGSWSEGDGLVHIRAALGSTVRVLAPGYAPREVVVEPGTQREETPQIVELQPAARLGVRFELSNQAGFDPKGSVIIELSSRDPFMAWLPALNERAGGKFRYDLYDHFYGEQIKRRLGSVSDERDAVRFQGLPGRILWVDGLLPGARFDVIVRDSLGEALVSESVVMPAAGATERVLVEFSDLYEMLWR